MTTLWPSTDSNITEQVSPSAIETERRRYELWVNNIAALQEAHLPSSLEYRIREDANARGAIKKSLAYLEESLQFALSIGLGEKQNETWNELIISDDRAGEDAISRSKSSEIVELYLSIQEAITNLFRLSMIIRKKPESDEYVRAASRYQIDPTRDIIHVADKYPTAKKDELPWLIQRLGVAITRRRQYLIFRREHQARMIQSHRMRTGPDGKTIWSGTKASTYLPDETLAPNENDALKTMKLTIDSSQTRPQTEYADSSRGRDGTTDFLRTPPLPRRQDGTRIQYDEDFECPYCRRLQKVHDKNEWKRHVLSDLRPYVCTFQPCDLNMFDSQHEWFIHELNFHREQWQCNFCKHQAPQTRPELKTHLETEHLQELTDQSLDALLERCRIERINATTCPLCKEYGAKFQRINQSSKCDVSLKQFQQHLGIHMQQLAFAALPQETQDEESEDHNSGDDDDDDGEVNNEAGTRRERLGLIILDFIAKGYDEISVSQGQVVRIIDDTDRKTDGWWRVRVHEKEGVVPCRLIRGKHVSKDRNENGEEVEELVKSDKSGENKEDEEKGVIHSRNELEEDNSNRPIGIFSLEEDEVEAEGLQRGTTDPESKSTNEILIIAERPLNMQRVPEQTGNAIQNVTSRRGQEDRGNSKEIATEGEARNGEVVDRDTAKEKPIRFTDALGRIFIFPYHLCRTWTGMDQLIRSAFVLYEPLITHVAQGHYDLVGPSGDEIDSSAWETTVEPDWSVTMKMWPLPPERGESFHANTTRPMSIPPAKGPLPARPLPPPRCIGPSITETRTEWPEPDFSKEFLIQSNDIPDRATAEDAVILSEEAKKEFNVICDSIQDSLLKEYTLQIQTEYELDRDDR